MTRNTARRLCCRSAAPVLTTLLLAALAANARAQTTLLFDDFNGPTLNPAFQASLPNGAPLGNGDGSCTYLGAPNYSFGSIGGASVLRITDTLNNFQRRGLSTNTVFNTSDFRFEVRFNVLAQSPSTSIDSFVEGWLIDPNDPKRFVIAGPHSGGYGANRQFRAGSENDSAYSGTSTTFSYADNTWYRLVLQSLAGQNVRASLLADDGTTELIAQTLSFSAAAFPAGFEVGLAQAMGAPGKPYPSDVAIDYVRLTSSPVPEPSSLVLVGCGLAIVMLESRSRNVRSSKSQP